LFLILKHNLLYFEAEFSSRMEFEFGFIKMENAQSVIQLLKVKMCSDYSHERNKRNNVEILWL